MWTEGLFRVAIFMVGGSLGALVMAMIAAGSREAPAPPASVHCNRCGSCDRCTERDSIMGPAEFLASGLYYQVGELLPTSRCSSCGILWPVSWLNRAGGVCGPCNRPDVWYPGGEKQDARVPKDGLPDQSTIK